MALVATSCADLKVQLQYAPDPRIEKLAASVPVTVFRFTDARGDEGDEGDVYRVGGVYNGYGMRLAKILNPTPWPEILVQDLGAGFSQRGVQTVLVEDRTYAPGGAVTTPLVLTGEIRNFSTENRWMGYLAHVSGVVRLYDQSGAKLIEKPVSARLRPNDEETQIPDGRIRLERLLNRAVAEFVHQVVTDPDLTQRLVAAR
ncbi:MAG: hypothetical protein ACREK9_20180 [Candidatus Rokuibacteriota bacterium]